MAKGEGGSREVGRQTPARGAHDFLGQPNVFFVTVNAKEREACIGTAAVQAGLVRLWRDEATAWRVGYYLLMPDHMHFFCSPFDLHFGIDTWISFWKHEFSRAHPDWEGTWQRAAFHRRMRDRVEYEEKLQYVRENPLRRGLVKALDDWPLQGRVHQLVW
jgi:putative transposase